MAQKVGGFKSEAGRRFFLELYDRAVDELWPMPADELDVDTRFGTTHVRRSGQGPGLPMVLIPGNSGTSVGWSRLVAPLAAGREVLAVDTVGTLGRSVQTRPLTGPRDLSPWLRDLLDGLETRHVHLVGYSEGGYVALHAALGNPDRLASLVAIDSGGTIERLRLRFVGSLAWTIVKILLRIPNAMRDFGERLSPGVEVSDLEWELMMSGAKSFRHALPMPKKVPDDHLRRLTTPTLLYMAANSEVYDPLKAARRAIALMPAVETVIVPDAHHGLPFTHTQRTIADILNFVERHEPDGADRDR